MRWVCREKEGGTKIPSFQSPDPEEVNSVVACTLAISGETEEEGVVRRKSSQSASSDALNPQAAMD